jgi:hypothetical protein
MMRAITTRAPWSSCVAVGAKPTENRGRAVAYRGELAIHAGLAVDVWAYGDSRVREALGPNLPALDLPTGAVIAVADLVDCHPAEQPAGLLDPTCCQPWGEKHHNNGPAFHLVLANIRALDIPVPCRGSLPIGWTVPAEVEEQVRAQLAGVRT